MKRQTFKYVPNPVPRGHDPELTEWLRREFAAVAQGLQGLWDMDVTTQAPERATEGMQRYADGVGWNPGAGKGPYVFDGVQWRKL